MWTEKKTKNQRLLRQPLKGTQNKGDTKATEKEQAETREENRKQNQTHGDTFYARACVPLLLCLYCAADRPRAAPKSPICVSVEPLTPGPVSAWCSEEPDTGVKWGGEVELIFVVGCREGLERSLENNERRNLY